MSMIELSCEGARKSRRAGFTKNRDVFFVVLVHRHVAPAPHVVLLVVHVVAVLVGRAVLDVRHQFLLLRLQILVLVAAITRPGDALLDHLVRDGLQLRGPAEPCEKVEKACREVEVIRPQFRGLVVPPA